VVKLIKISIGLATFPDLCHPVIFGSGNRQGITLPSSKPLLEKLNRWQEIYNQINISNRKLKGNNDAPANVSKAELSNLVGKCQEYGDEVLEDFNIWLESVTFIKEISKQYVNTNDKFQILLQVVDKDLEKLPWHLANVFQRFNTEVALFKPPTSDRESKKNITSSTIRILAAFGSDNGIETEKDLKKLKQLQSDLCDLVVLGKQKKEKLSKENLFNKLSKEQWDILFFAGHSSSSSGDRKGRIYLDDECDGLNFEKISYAIDRAVKNGLKIAFFNSCDGLGMGHSLSQLGVHQIILMKESVPDIIAQKFLKNFLEQYSQGSSFYQSVRYARENLQGEDFPCATWLPTIYQSSEDYPPSWEDLQGTTREGIDLRDKSPKPPYLSVENIPKKSKRYIPTTLSLAACIFVVISTIILNRKQPYSPPIHKDKWQPYQNAEIQFDHPPQWQADPIDFTSELESDISGATLKIYSSVETNKSCSDLLTLNIKTTPTSGYTLDLYRQDKIRRVRNPDTNDEVQITEITTPDTKLADRQAYRLNFQRNDRRCKRVKSLETGTIDRGKIYVLNYSFIPDGREEARQRIFDRIAASFKIKGDK
jgi:CHAT domain